MHKRNRWFILFSLLYAIIGGLVALTWLVDPTLLPGNVTRMHAHLMMLGFIAMMIFGIGLHVIPRFSGRALFSERLANWQFYLANIGLLTMVSGWLSWHNTVVGIGGGIYWLAILLFVVNIAATVKHYGPQG